MTGNKKSVKTYKDSKIKLKNQGFHFWFFVVCVLFLLPVGFFALRSNVSLARLNSEKMNVLVIMTDDQRYDTLFAMPKVQELIVKKGVNFTNATVSTPLCCPSRASFLSGGYFAYNTGVLGNAYPNGGAAVFAKYDKNTMPRKLQRAGFYTGLFGKYLNNPQDISSYFPTKPSPYIPPGWDNFVVTTEENTPKDWFNFPVVKGSSKTDQPSSGIEENIHDTYVNDYFTDEMMKFLDSTKKEAKPFFALFATHGPHLPAASPVEDRQKFSDYVHHAPSLKEADLSDKPKYVLEKSLIYDEAQTIKNYIKILRSLQSIDRSIEKIVNKLKELDILEKTMIVFVSDNGNLWGEHKLIGKNTPYEESIRVPFVVVYPGGRVNVSDDSFVYGNLDLAATIQEVAKIPKDTDGVSLMPLLSKPNSPLYNKPKKPWRDDLYAVWFRENNTETIPSWVAMKQKVKDIIYKYVEYQSGEKEFYVLTNDPYEENNLVNDPKYASRISAMAVKVNPKKGLSISSLGSKNSFLKNAFVGKPYYFKFDAWGGTKPYTWSMWNNTSLPKGLVLNSKTGEISGTPTSTLEESIKGPATFLLSVKAVDSSKARYIQRPQEFILDFRLMLYNDRDIYNQKIDQTLKLKELQKVKFEFDE